MVRGILNYNSSDVSFICRRSFGRLFLFWGEILITSKYNTGDGWHASVVSPKISSYKIRSISIHPIKSSFKLSPHQPSTFRPFTSAHRQGYSHTNYLDVLGCYPSLGILQPWTLLSQLQLWPLHLKKLPTFPSVVYTRYVIPVPRVPKTNVDPGKLLKHSSDRDDSRRRSGNEATIRQLSKRNTNP